EVRLRPAAAAGPGVPPPAARGAGLPTAAAAGAAAPPAAVAAGLLPVRPAAADHPLPPGAGSAEAVPAVHRAQRRHLLAAAAALRGAVRGGRALRRKSPRAVARGLSVFHIPRPTG